MSATLHTPTIVETNLSHGHREFRPIVTLGRGRILAFGFHPCGVRKLAKKKGKSGVVAHDHEGNLRWQADVGDRTHGWGMAAKAEFELLAENDFDASPPVDGNRFLVRSERFLYCLE